MSFRIVDHYPTINAINIAKNSSVVIEFNKGIVPQTVDYSHFSVNDASTYSTVVGDLGVEYDTSGVCTMAVFQPTTNMTANTKYRVYVFGNPNSIVSVNNEQLTSTYSFEFTVGTGVLVSPFPEGIPTGVLPTSGTISVSGLVLDSGLYTSLETSGLLVVDTYPSNQTPNVAITSGSVRILFNTDLLTSASDMSGFVSLTISDVLY